MSKSGVSGVARQAGYVTFLIREIIQERHYFSRVQCDMWAYGADEMLPCHPARRPAVGRDVNGTPEFKGARLKPRRKITSYVTSVQHFKMSMGSIWSPKASMSASQGGHEDQPRTQLSLPR